ncbi:MAG: hypothetical protein U5P10_16410 [Spirochaetia bacterium]|nr:hypothetical protein [Spirochaetia bacterium]
MEMVIDRNNSMVIKEYKRVNLLDDYFSRLKIIKQISMVFDLLTPTSFTVDGVTVFYYQEYIIKKRLPSDTKAIYHLLLTFAKEYDVVSEHGFVHGDINKKNVLYDGEKLLLCDLEPSLRQIRNNRTMLMYTPPYVSKNDFLSGVLSSDTDKIGFYFLCYKLLGFKTEFDVKIIMGIRNAYRHNKADNWYSILPFPEEELPDMSFRGLLDFAANQQK